MAKEYKVKEFIAKEKNTPVYFIAETLIETKKAIYLYGQGSNENPVEPEHRIDSWFPKSQIEEINETKEMVVLPSEHPILNKGKKEVKRIATKENDKVIKITFPFNTDDLGFVKSIPGRNFQGHENPKHWLIPLNIENIKKLIGYDFPVSEELKNHMKETSKTIDDIKEIEIPGLKVDLFPFQKKGVAFLEAKKGRALIGDKMGLGKTIQALAWLQLHPEARPAVVVVKASAKMNWAWELKSKMTNANVQVLSGMPDKDTKFTGDIIVLNYDILPNKWKKQKGNKKMIEQEFTGWVDYLIQLKPKVLILDECQSIKNNNALRTKAAKKIGKKVKHIIALSGTPFLNRPIEMFNTIKLIQPSFSTWVDYVRRYCDGTKGYFGWDVSGASNTKELHERLKTIMVRRTKEEVIDDLPAKIRSFVPMEIPENDQYFHAEDDFISWVLENKGRIKAEAAKNAEALVKIGELKRLAAEAKLDQAIGWIKDFLEDNGKLVVFANHKFVIDKLMNEFKDIAVKIDGSIPTNKRKEVVDQFQNNDKIKLFVGNIKAAGDSITLTAADHACFIELPWTPGELEQCEDRIYARMNDLHGAMIYFLLADNTIDVKIARLLDSKQAVLDAVLDGKETEQTTMLGEIINSYSKKEK